MPPSAHWPHPSQLLCTPTDWRGEGAPAPIYRGSGPPHPGHPRRPKRRL